MSYNTRIREGYKNMNNTMKITDINTVLNNLEKDECPYCHEPLTPFLSGTEKKLGCDNCELEITKTDYLNAIYNIVHGYNNEKLHFKPLTAF